MTDTSELVRRLRKVAVAAERPDGTDCPLSEQLKEVSDRLEALEAQNERLREAIKPFSTLDIDIGDEWFDLCQAARAALKEGEK